MIKPLSILSRAAFFLSLCSIFAPETSRAQDITTPQPPPVKIYSPKDTKAPAKELFGRIPSAAHPGAQPRSLGSYARGCLSGGVALAADGSHWQTMRLSRNRNWGHPALIATLTHFAAKVPTVSAWPGILIGDLSQPRGGPMLTGHASHQIGLDADVWLTPMPEKRFTWDERETVSAINVVADDWNGINPQVWTSDHFNVIRLAAQLPGVERVFVNPAIKKALCQQAKGDRSWLATIRPMYGHHYHMHLRLKCPAGVKGCVPQAPPPRHDGCGTELAWWFSAEARKPKKSSRPAPPITLGQLPDACRAVIADL